MDAATGYTMLRETLSAYEVRVTLGFAFSMSAGGSTQCATFELREPNNGNRWTKVKLPAILPPEGETSRVALLRSLADCLEAVELEAEAKKGKK